MDNSQSANRILVVEDDEISQFLIMKMMSDLGFSAEICSNGPDAIELLQKEHFDLVLMDIEMPIISGFETTRRIRNIENEWLKNIPIIGISANPFENELQPYLDRGMNDYISKPIHEPELMKKIESLLIK